MRGIEICSIFLALLDIGSTSRCPEPKKPHPTSCTIFYNCINLPGGGYVWAPAKCTNGLVFQPYLRMCVLPGDSWTCDILSTESPETTTQQIPNLIDSTQTSYLEYAEDGVSKYGESLDNTDKYSEKGDSVQPTVTPYPLIEATPPNTYSNQIDSTIQNIGLPIAIKHSEDNYLYHFVNGQQALATPSNANGGQLQNHLQRLTQLIERLIAYQAVGVPLDRQPAIATTSAVKSTIANPPAQYTSNGYNTNAERFPNSNRDSAILNLLIKNYILKSQLQNDKAAGLPSDAGTKEPETTDLRDQEESTTVDSLDVVLNGPQAADNIVVVSDSLENRQYFTISKYKRIAHMLTTETVELIPCTSGVRLPNSTDCTKYYRCDPDTAKIRQFSCPKNTAFNQYKRLCETNEYALCLGDSGKTSLRISATTTRPKTTNSLEKVSDGNPCQTIGKHGDPSSENHYYLCYSDKKKSTDIEYRRMVCPNSLIFCQQKNVCTTRKRCEAI
ncbi:uncharacterized protein LOC124294795 [Neodiprion lecontei]|uniref:Uncharacterized protein LOC124294795 n=1 Tax=Neodiprion lecontei TaxID=441921 RepID=A0ABM3GCC8_NEOLC|nr:uncharacterized protein LOC124294795 [Neodiprion lecontei]